MPNYYDMLNLPPTATTGEIEAAYEAQYNRWRRLVTHHDPDTVNKANQALRRLEKVHATLTDPARREAYDARIGVRGPAGGLADPTVTPARPAAPIPPRPKAGATSQSAPPTARRVDAWVCPQCQTPNPVGTHFCEQCGETLGQECPRCANWIKAQAVFCPECGVNVPELRQQQLQQERLHAQMEVLQSQIEQIVAQKRPMPQLSSWGALGQAILTLFSVLGIFIGIGLFLMTFAEGQFWGIPAGVLSTMIGIACFWLMNTLSKRRSANIRPIREHNKQIDERVNQVRRKIQALNDQLENRA